MTQDIKPPPSAFLGMQGLSQRLTALDADLSQIVDAPDPAIAASARKLRRQLRDFEPSVTMIGQVKAGKTTLVNAMVGWPDLLPADVNPWTSVVTSLHLQPRMARDERRSAFRFFSNDEWDHLIRQGGRVGEIASRAGAEDELEKVRAQLDEMRQKSQARLGRNFQMLLGQTHDYDCFDEDLIQRYVCLGDDFWEDADGSPDQGRFADITKSADLWFSRPQMPLNLCIQDTPGVNDTFMIREQITINALRGSRLCVMVLSAQQALSSVDLGLIRLISNVKSRDVVIFVNRIDELADPVREVPEIRASITETLRKFDGPADAAIVFGSGYWASHAVGNTCNALGEDSAAALVAWAESELTDIPPETTAQDAIWHLSGLPALGQVIAERIEQGDGKKLVERIETARGNLRTGLAAYGSVTRLQPDAMQGPCLSQAEILHAFDTIEAKALANLENKLIETAEAFHTRTENARLTFLSRATASLLKHLEAFGESEVWTYDPSGLRILLRSAYQVFVRAASKVGSTLLQETADDISALYQNAFDLGEDSLRIAPPPLPVAAPPVALGQTIALDLRGSWWNRFWRRKRGYAAFSDDFAKLIHEETVPIVNTLRTQNADPFAIAIRDLLRDFIDEQRGIVTGLNTQGPGQAAEPPDGAHFGTLELGKTA